MRDYWVVMLLGSAVFLALVMLLAAKPAFTARLTACAGVVAAVGGFLIYGYGYIATFDSLMLAVIRAVFAVCCMFIGEIDFSAISEAPLFQHKWGEILFWVIQLLAFFTTASTAISVIGADALRKARLWLTRWKELNLIYGLNEDSLGFGQELLADESGVVLFVEEDPDASLSEAVSSSGCILRTDPAAIHADAKFLKSLGLRRGSRKVTLYALSKDYAENIRYAKALLAACQKLAMDSRQISLVIHARENDSVRSLQVEQDRYGYGFVTVYQEHGLVARLLMQKYPPCNCITFDETGAATEDFEAVLIGFGQLGQSVLKSLVMNGQFVGSTFRAAVFSPDCQNVNGYFTNSFKGVLDHYDITFHPYDGRSTQMYDYLTERKDRIKYLVINTGSEKVNDEIAEELRSFLYRTGNCIPIYQCSYRGIKMTDAQTLTPVVHKLYDPSVLNMRSVDNMAMIINQYYLGANSRGALDDWMACDYFSRMSSRASADFVEAMLRAAGKTEQQAVSGQWEFTPAHLENLSKMEHQRWCAFHYCMGFLPMSDAEYAERARIYQEQLKKNGKASIRIGKNMDGRTHACLVDWDALDDLSAKENRITGKNVDYKKMDTDNVLIVPELLQNRGK